ncbi:hypothetical protein D9753_34045 [Streptomyces dangxiongensis]|uniref:DUF4097 domain-containing protein n=1 Tax=Streptomyces dangxiongensis TaxID=1442032 RepID=A0A3G2JL50_9ACTN|nr:DUF4097 family beta strand repeat-containing protein [Streptomyces dangxiongensis]AYN43074.1 hypothetical protein D9753_34045 [Streptomyces dangxiongensis]
MKVTERRCLPRLTAVLALLPLAVACGGAHQGSGGGTAAAGPAPGALGDTLVVTSDNGLRLRPADGHRVTVDGHVDQADRHWSHHAGTWVLDLSCGRRDDADRGRDDAPCPRMPEVDVPDGVSVTVSARNAGIDAVGVPAGLDLTTVNGDVTVTRSGRSGDVTRLATRNGSVRAVALDARRLTAVTTNGDVILACGTAPTAVTARTTNGSVGVTVPHDSPAYRVTAATANGRATVDVPARKAGHGPAMKLTTVNGDVDARRD